jgi:hypothetical protein
MTFSNARSSAFGSTSALTSRAMSRKRWYSAGSSGSLGPTDLRDDCMPAIIAGCRELMPLRVSSYLASRPWG